MSIIGDHLRDGCVSRYEVPSIWSSIEFDAISRDFNYENYISMWNRSGTDGAFLSKSAYMMLKDIFSQEMDSYFRKQHLLDEKYEYKRS